MIGPSGGSGPGWYYKGKHYSAPQELHEAMNAEIGRMELQISALTEELNEKAQERQRWIKEKYDADRLVDEARKVIQTAHTAGYRFGMGACVCSWCATEKRSVSGPKCEHKTLDGRMVCNDCGTKFLDANNLKCEHKVAARLGWTIYKCHDCGEDFKDETR